MEYSRRGDPKSQYHAATKDNPKQMPTVHHGRTPTVALEREAYVPSLDLYTEATALQRAVNTTNHPVYRDISA